MVFWAAALSVASLVDPAEAPHRDQQMTAPIAIVPVRLLRKNTLGVEVGLNTLVGAGLHYSRSITPHLNLETGFGLAFQSVKVGLRARANFLASDFTPFVAAGVMYGTGTLGVLQTSDRGNLIAYKIERSPFVQGTLGLAWTTRSGFCMLTSLGWAQLLRHNNVVIKAGTPTQNQLERLTFSAGSGPTGSLALGFSF
jgi:hypothetical protein